MKKLTSLIISCSLALAAAAFAQQPDEQSSPSGAGKGKAGEHAGAGKNRRGGNAEKGPNAQGKSEMNAQGGGQNGGANADKQGGNNKAERRAARQERRQEAAANNADASASPKAEANANANPEANAANDNQAGGKQGRKGRNARNNNRGEAKMKAQENANANAGQGENQANANAVKGHGKGGKVVEKTKVTEIKKQHVNFRAQPKPEKVPAVTFNVNYRIQGSEHWQGPQYEVFRAYRPERHDEHWYRSHYTRVELIGGGYYYWNNGYWYPAWGFSPAHEYYAYDGPIYVGHRAEPPDQVIADVQAELQDMGYYTGEVDGLLGPLTRQALTDYQTDNGLLTTAAIDEPTLDSLGMG